MYNTIVTSKYSSFTYKPKTHNLFSQVIFFYITCTSLRQNSTLLNIYHSCHIREVVTSVGEGLIVNNVPVEDIEFTLRHGKLKKIRIIYTCSTCSFKILRYKLSFTKYLQLNKYFSIVTKQMKIV